MKDFFSRLRDKIDKGKGKEKLPPLPSVLPSSTSEPNPLPDIIQDGRLSPVELTELLGHSSASTSPALASKLPLKDHRNAPRDTLQNPCAASFQYQPDSTDRSSEHRRRDTCSQKLFEIICSEERYMQELVKMKDTFIDPLLHPYSSSSRTVSPISPSPKFDYRESSSESTDRTLPIAARFLSPAAKDNHPRSNYRRSTGNGTSSKLPNAAPSPSRLHHSLPPPPRATQFNSSTMSLGRQSTGLGDTVASHQLPEDLRICFEVIDNSVFDGHKRLFEALRKRYDDQYPLVRSLADIFVENSGIFQGYAEYILHLERALEQVDAALSNVSTKEPKNQDVAEWQKVCNVLQKLEETASEKGEVGLAIALSTPFRRLLKYPLLFQNLLFHTDPSMFEYESTLQMVAEVEVIVRSIEDEKIVKEQRDKTRDVFARIEGLDKVRHLTAPKPSRVLMEERQYLPTAGSLAEGESPQQSPPSKPSFEKLSDALGRGKDLWLVVFNDVELLCQRTGTTSLPIVAAANFRSKHTTTRRRSSHTEPRNLYKFIKIESWRVIKGVIEPVEGIISKEDIARSRAREGPPVFVPRPDDEDDDSGSDSDDSDSMSKMFSYWGAGVVVQRPLIRPRVAVRRVREPKRFQIRAIRIPECSRGELIGGTAGHAELDIGPVFISRR